MSRSPSLFTVLENGQGAKHHDDDITTTSRSPQHRNHRSPIVELPCPPASTPRYAITLTPPDAKKDACNDWLTNHFCTIHI